MNLLLLRHNRFRLALNMKRVARVQSLGETVRYDPLCLMSPEFARTAVILTNRHILPASEIETTAEWPGPIGMPDAFFRGCSRSPMIGGFVIFADQVYGVLSDRFLHYEEKPCVHFPMCATH
jgi:hypothetical protein